VSRAAAVARLFLAVPVARPVTEALLKLQPPPSDSVKLVAEADFHITLHFLGSRAIDSVRRALGTLTARAFVTRMDRTGIFSLPGGRQVFWAGIESAAGLIALHRESADALAAVGFKPENRPFRPHITLARIAAGSPARVADESADSPLPGGPVVIECRECALYASDQTQGGVRYRILERYPLTEGS
jgi:2'-5' RNA ligase